jgi:hypothetical protein
MRFKRIKNTFLSKNSRCLMPRKRHKLPPKPSVESIQRMLSRRRWDYVPPQAPPPAEPKPSPLPESVGDVNRRSIGLPPVTRRASDTAKPDERYQPTGPDTPIRGTSSDRQAYADLLAICQPYAPAAPSRFQNRPTARDAAAQANRDRILKRFHDTEFAGELLPNGKILYDCREMSLEQWERERFATQKD